MNQNLNSSPQFSFSHCWNYVHWMLSFWRFPIIWQLGDCQLPSVFNCITA